jgi:hypothetical protein
VEAASAGIPEYLSYGGCVLLAHRLHFNQHWQTTVARMRLAGVAFCSAAWRSCDINVDIPGGRIWHRSEHDEWLEPAALQSRSNHRLGRVTM